MGNVAQYYIMVFEDIFTIYNMYNDIKTSSIMLLFNDFKIKNVIQFIKKKEKVIINLNDLDLATEHFNMFTDVKITK